MARLAPASQLTPLRPGPQIGRPECRMGPMRYEHFVAAQRQWSEEDRAPRLGSRHEPVAHRFRPAPRKSWWKRLVDWWRGPKKAP
jgi:hypothetical protein